jgi:7-cyano-7-deazaguanine synthase
MDSVTLLHQVHAGDFGKFEDIRVMSVNYGQRHKRELRCAKWHATLLGLEHKLIDMSAIGKQILQGSALTSDIEVPDGHYEADNAKITVVPSRNMLLLSLATSYLVSTMAQDDFGTVFYGAHAGDFAVYADCRPEFVDAMCKAIALCDFKHVALSAPYAGITKADIAKRAVDLGLVSDAPWLPTDVDALNSLTPEQKRQLIPLAHTHTCYKGFVPACGTCCTCVERVLAFAKVGAVDPIPYKKGWKHAVAAAKQTEADYFAKKNAGQA